MKNRFLLIVLTLSFLSCTGLDQVLRSLPQGVSKVGLSNLDIANGLREALDLGIDKQVSKLTRTDGFYRNQLVKILLPNELQRVDQSLRKLGLSSLADEGLRLMNRAAENAVKEATPIFIQAVKSISFADAKKILLGADQAATQYLQRTTNSQLYQKFTPVIKSSFSKVGANRIWSSIISKYNSIPLTKKVNPNLTDYVTNQALKGVYTMIAIEEKEIRNKVNARSSALLQKVFALQD